MHNTRGAALLLLLVATNSIVLASQVTSVTGDLYIDEAYNGCQTKDTFSCAKYRALTYIHKLALGHVSTGRGFNQLPMLENVRLIRLPETNKAQEEVYELFDAVPRSSDSELMKFYRFGLREVERFARTYAVAVAVPESQTGLVPRFITEDDLQQGRALEDESRGKKKKLQLLLPLLILFKFFKLKVLLIPILLGVLAIKKILILAAIFLPSILSVLKFCKQQPLYHEYSAAPAYDYGVTGYAAPGSSGSYGKEIYSRRNYDAQALAYRGQQQQQQQQQQ
ncbi:hypothetical protein B566_EDAN009209 [Ephemera danica]|nr:hypothetical protein B566_EDAN009209 [Ephemera danica]